MDLNHKEHGGICLYLLTHFVFPFCIMIQDTFVLHTLWHGPVIYSYTDIFTHYYCYTSLFTLYYIVLMYATALYINYTSFTPVPAPAELPNSQTLTSSATLCGLRI
ncbi:hypothetical protein XELAEV_18025741mg [Xenopus laevis]|uniref:Uncharacterized protein n=1 Tax=Xenopus laevis TaxID=8355 RepID=A0A974D075_XENLA|nr:hypothetical protein XELAEV_18025741mg [Xenopus laevis]